MSRKNKYRDYVQVIIKKSRVVGNKEKLPAAFHRVSDRGHGRSTSGAALTVPGGEGGFLRPLLQVKSGAQQPPWPGPPGPPAEPFLIAPRAAEMGTF